MHAQEPAAGDEQSKDPYAPAPKSHSGREVVDHLTSERYYTDDLILDKN